MEQRYFICEHCGNMIAMVNDSGVPVVCCGQKMTELIPGSVDAAQEKHVPVVTIDGNTVTVSVGSAAHPMLAQHFIEWISIHTTQGNQRKILQPSAEPKAVFALTTGESVISAYAYCNLHGLWKADA